MDVPPVDWPAYHTPHSVRREHVPAALDKSRILDKPSAPHPILSLLMDDALRIILMTSDGGVAALKERTTGSKAGTIAPTSALAATVDELGSRFGQCKTHRARLAVIKEAQTTADRMRYAPDRSQVRGTAEWREAISRDPRSCRVLAVIHDVNFSTISRIKKAAR